MPERFQNFRVLLVGTFDKALHAHAALCARALERLGCQVVVFNLAGSGGWLSRFRGIGLQDRLVRAIQLAGPDVVLVLEGEQLPAPLVAALKQESAALWVNWFWDGQRPAAAVLPLTAAYDMVFAAGEEIVARLQDPGNPPAAYLPPGCDPSIHRPMRSRDQFRANVVFAGRATPHRERLLGELVEFGLGLWGPGWRRTRLRDYCRGELLDHTDYVRAYAGASVAVNLQCCDPGDPEGIAGSGPRLFELAAIGVPQVVEDHAELHRHFREGSEVLVAHSPVDMKGLTAEALHDRAWADQVAAGARQRALAVHTYMHRLASLLRQLPRRVLSAEC
jgi:spore maturation protein CgeB